MPGFVERNGIRHFKQMANLIIGDLLRFGFVVKYADTGGTIHIPYDASKEVITASGAPAPDLNADVTVSYTVAATLEVTKAVDPLAEGAPLTLNTSPDPVNPQPWRIRIDASECKVKTGDPGYLRVFIAHPYQLPDHDSPYSPEPAMEYLGAGTYNQYPRKSGELTCGYQSGTYQMGGGLVPGVYITKTIPFMSSWFTMKTNPSQIFSYGSTSARPFSYMLSVSDRGVALVAWQEASDDYGNRFSWFVAQRPVDPISGATLARAGSKNPVFCMYSIGGGEPSDSDALAKIADITALDIYSTSMDPLGTGASAQPNPYLPPKIYRFTVRESDVFRPTTPVLATVDSPDNRAVINGKQQVAISEDGQYVVYYPNGFNTDRYMYREEFDMLTYTSADVISQWQEVELQPYAKVDGGVARTYKACQANLGNNSGMRLLIMVDGAGIVRPAKENDWHNP